MLIKRECDVELDVTDVFSGGSVDQACDLLRESANDLRVRYNKLTDVPTGDIIIKTYCKRYGYDGGSEIGLVVYTEETSSELATRKSKELAERKRVEQRISAKEQKIIDDYELLMKRKGLL